MDANKFEVVGEVYQTTDYSMFKMLNGNRTVLNKRKLLILNSIKERGWIRNPIIVNEKMEIIDGQGRFEALKELGLPVEYVIAQGAGIDDCIALNIKQKNWSLDDYVHCYAENGFEEYIFVERLYNTYHRRISNNTILQIAGVVNGDKIPYKEIKNGEYVVMDRNSVDMRIQFIIEMLNIVGKQRGRIRTWTSVFKFIYYSSSIDRNSLKKKLNKYIEFVTPAVTTEQAIRSLEAIYNRGRKDKVYFMPEYEKYKKLCRSMEK